MRILLLHPSREFLRLIAPFIPHVTLKSRHPGGSWDVLIRWGVDSGSDAPFTYNAAWALENLGTLGWVRSLLQVNGIPYRSHGDTPARKAERAVARYRVHMVDLNVVAVYRIRRGAEVAVDLPSSPRGHTLTTLARRTLYALGLHFGAVDIVVDRRGKPAVVRVAPAPALEPPLIARYGEALASSIRTLTHDLTTPAGERSARILLGADPEFIVVRRHNHALRYASDLFPREGGVGYDRQSRVVQGRRRHPIAELRPKPAESPYALLANLQKELARAYRMAPDRNADWLAGAHPGPGCYTGGHIHFSGVQPSTFLLRALDTYLALPTLLIENPRGARARRPRYGSLGEFREKEHGGFEYRTLSSWITGMQRARATLCLAKLVAVEYPQLRQHLLRTPLSHLAFYQGQRAHFREHVDALWDDMRATPSYQEYSQDLERTRIWIHNRRQWRESVDLKRLWHIR